MGDGTSFASMLCLASRISPLPLFSSQVPSPKSSRKREKRENTETKQRIMEAHHSSSDERPSFATFWRKNDGDSSTKSLTFVQSDPSQTNKQGKNSHNKSKTKNFNRLMRRCLALFITPRALFLLVALGPGLPVSDLARGALFVVLYLNQGMRICQHGSSAIQRRPARQVWNLAGDSPGEMRALSSFGYYCYRCLCFFLCCRARQSRSCRRPWARVRLSSRFHYIIFAGEQVTFPLTSYLTTRSTRVHNAQKQRERERDTDGGGKISPG